MYIFVSNKKDLYLVVIIDSIPKRHTLTLSKDKHTGEVPLYDPGHERS